MRIYYPFNPKISRAMHRIRNAFIRYAPPSIEFLDNPEPDAIHILDFIGQHPSEQDRELMADVPSIPATRRYIIIYHCPPPPWLLDLDYSRFFHGSLLVISAYTPEIAQNACRIPNLEFSELNWLTIPWGYDPQIFYPEHLPKKYLVLATGYAPEPEYIYDLHHAVSELDEQMVHIGGNIGLDNDPNYTRFQNIPDDQLRRLYSQSLYVSALRDHIGFEMVGIEGYACGARPIYLDLPCYRYWFWEIGVFVKPRIDPYTDIHHQLKYVLNQHPGTMDPSSIERFRWEKIIPSIWERILESV